MGPSSEDQNLNPSVVMNRLNPHTKALLGSYSLAHRGFVLTPAHNFAKGTTTVSLSKKLDSGLGLKASYALKDKTALLELGRAPFTVRSIPLCLL